MFYRFGRLAAFAFHCRALGLAQEALRNSVTVPEKERDKYFPKQEKHLKRAGPRMRLGA